MPNLGPAFYKKLIAISSELGMKPEAILNVMSIESGIDPAAHNKNGNASGLVQFMPDTLKGLGFQGSHTDFRELAAIQQLDYVKKWISDLTQQNGGPLTATTYYIGNFLPVALKLPGVKRKDPKTILVARNPKRPHLPGVSIKREKSFYDSNQVLDYNKDGFITYGDIENILKKYSNSQNYQLALSNMKKYTGYIPKNRSKNMLGVNMEKKYNQPTQNLPNPINNLLDSFLKNVAATEKFDKKLYKNLLPNNNILISINSDNYNNSIEFARILCSTLDTELLSTSFTHTDGDDVEVECKISGPTLDCLATVKQLTYSVAEVFYEATKKIGGVQVKAEIIMDKKSSYQEINLKFAEIQYRTFLLKFI